MNFPGPLTQLGRYQLTSVLGRGAMGLVYEATDPRLGRKVAVKTILKSHLLDDAMARDYSARFVREAQAAARLNHPNIVTVFDFGEEDEVAYIVMEFIEGRELAQHFDDNHFFDRANALRIMCELLDALSYAHDRGIVHRDIKPANVMIDRLGRVKLTDFGVARLADSNADRTLPGTMVGTPSYMSPEQIQGQAVGSRADLFAAGVILYQFLTHQKPFTGAGQWTIQRKIVNEDPVPPSFANQNVPAVFDAIVQRALAKHPDHRYQTATEFAIDLQRAFATTGAVHDDPEATIVASRPMSPRFLVDPSSPPAVARTGFNATGSTRTPAALRTAPPPAPGQGSGMTTATAAPPATASPAPQAAPAGLPPRWVRPGAVAILGAGLALATALWWWGGGETAPTPTAGADTTPPPTQALPAPAAAPVDTTSAPAAPSPAAIQPPSAAPATQTRPEPQAPPTAAAQRRAPPAAQPDGALRPATAPAAAGPQPQGANARAGSTVGSNRDGAGAAQAPVAARGNAARCADLLQRLQLGEDLSPENLNVFQKECKR